ncbi:MAG: UDP-glucose/GDP-mannose dehydrogenase family protein [Cyclobacteriaceae bacterium]|nr:UDP-glucose/GDP-mannose dehydrogenase family protein [Cyclobacteriaceae bacterium]MDW8330852.1 UDP-glucose/GDP-mannose dehydrogenase family protein [Cyclobacteriaceae bacterium]
MKIAVVGTGYVGLVTGACLAESGNTVTCIDIDREKIEKLRQGIMPIFERGLLEIVRSNVAHNRLSFTTSLAEGIKEALIILLALPTPPGEDGSADLQYVLKVADDIGPLLKQYTVIVNKSTVPVGTAELVRARIAAKARVEFDVVSNPEFLREGLAVEDFLKPERVVVGTRSERARKIMAQLYAPFTRQGNPILFMDERSSELTKYAANAFLATKITFMNEIATLCEKLGANVDHVRLGMGTDSRIGKRFLFAGIGYGGSCFPKDVQALAHTARQAGYTFRILEAVEAVNQRQRLEIARRLIDFFGGSVLGKKIALWGLAFKPHTDDIREAPALYNINLLLEKGAILTVHDPEAMENVKKLYGNRINYTDDPYEALNGAEALLIATEWPVYRNPDFSEMASRMKNKLIFDGRNLFELDQIRELGFTYFSIGRETVLPK